MPREIVQVGQKDSNQESQNQEIKEIKEIEKAQIDSIIGDKSKFDLGQEIQDLI